MERTFTPQSLDITSVLTTVLNMCLQVKDAQRSNVHYGHRSITRGSDELNIYQKYWLKSRNPLENS